MKKQIILSALFISIVGSSLGQTWGGSTNQTGNTYRTDNVGIGNSSPTFKLDIQTADINGGIRIRQTSSSAGASALWLDGSYTGVNGRLWGILSTGQGNSGGEGVGHFNIVDYTNGSRLFIKGSSTGEIGVGTTDPQSKFHVIGGARFNKDGSDNQFGAHLYLANVVNNKAYNFQLNSGGSSLNLWTYEGTWENKFTFTGTGNLGVGAQTPAEKLHVVGAAKIESPAGTGGGIRLFKDGSATFGSHLYLCNAANNKAFNFQLNAAGTGMDLWTYNGSWNNQFTFNNLGNLGIGITSPQAYLHVCTPDNSGTGLIIEQKYTSAYAVGASIKTWNDYSTAFQVLLNGATTPNVFSIQGNGKTKIGGTIPSNHTDAYLAVAGKVVCKEVVVTVNNWADYVFEKDYKLPDLKSVKEYYTANKHLPGIPAASQIIENGLNVTEISTLQMQKIEELTLYLIQMKEEIEQLKKENQELKAEIKK
jgi:hypothetical protein